MKTVFLVLFIFLSFTCVQLNAQTPLSANYTTAANRAKLYRTMVLHSINKNLSAVLADSTEELWADGFYTLELLLYRSPWVDSRIREALNYFPRSSNEFKRSMLELLFTNYKGHFTKEIAVLANDLVDPKLFAMALEYVMSDSLHIVSFENLIALVLQKFEEESFTNPILISLLAKRKLASPFLTKKMLDQLFDPLWLPNNVLLYSIQRKNRDYPGIVLVRDTSGKFITADDGQVFNVPHLARSISNLPSYLTNGNTPQGIYRMHGFAVSKSQAIGPSVNVQMEMPVECSIAKFLKDSTIIDSVWNIGHYESILPHALHRYFPFYEAYYAGEAGRTEIIAHGTTVDPKFYEGKPYHPHTPSLGCLTTSERWDENGIRRDSNQQKLVDALIKAGGANGYCIVIEIDDKNQPVAVGDIEHILNRASSGK